MTGKREVRDPQGEEAPSRSFPGVFSFPAHPTAPVHSALAGGVKLGFGVFPLKPNFPQKRALGVGGESRGGRLRFWGPTGKPKGSRTRREHRHGKGSLHHGRILGLLQAGNSALRFRMPPTSSRAPILLLPLERN